MGGAIAEKSFGEFVIGIAFTAFFELRDSSQMPCCVMQLAEFDDLILILVVLLLEFFLFGIEIIGVISRVRFYGLSLRIEFKNGRHSVIQKCSIVRDDECRAVKTR